MEGESSLILSVVRTKLLGKTCTFSPPIPTHHLASVSSVRFQNIMHEHSSRSTSHWATWASRHATRWPVATLIGLVFAPPYSCACPAVGSQHAPENGKPICGTVYGRGGLRRSKRLGPPPVAVRREREWRGGTAGASGMGGATWAERPGGAW